MAKMQVTFQVCYGVALVSRLGGSAIGVGLCFFGLFEKVDSSRIWPATEPYPNHWTHHVVVVPEDDIGDEIKARIHAAYSFALIK